MVEERKIKIVTEDIVMGGERGSSEFASCSFSGGYNDFKFPLTVSFCEHGEYIVKIEGKKAVVEKVK